MLQLDWILKVFSDLNGSMILSLGQQAGQQSHGLGNSLASIHVEQETPQLSPENLEGRQYWNWAGKKNTYT